MIRRISTQCLLTPSDVAPSAPHFEVVSVFNPGVAEHNGEVILLARVAERPTQQRDGYVCSPRAIPGEGITLDWFAADDVFFQDPRAFENKKSGNVRLTFISYLRVFRSSDGRSFRADDAVFVPQLEEEEFGVEDPRITRLGDTFYFTYVAVSRHGACTALASTQDFKAFTRHGIIFAAENKDVLLFPDTLDGDYLALHRPNPRYQFSPPEMWLARSADLIHWGRHAILHTGTTEWETGRIGGGVPPIKTDRGWLEIYHANAKDPGGGVGPYVGGALLLDLHNPARVIGRTRHPIMAPEADFETSGFLNKIVFPTGLVMRDGTALIFYGSADAYTGLVELDFSDILDAIQPISSQIGGLTKSAD